MMARSKSSRHCNAAGMLAALLFICGATPALAQIEEREAAPDPGFITRVPAPVRSVLPSRLRNLERLEFEAEDLDRRRLRMSDAQLRGDIRAQLQKAGVECDVAALRRVGSTGSLAVRTVYEAACTQGPGYVLVNGVKPTATHCLVLAGGAANARLRNPDADVGAQCELPENRDAARLISNWAREAGVACRVDQAGWIGPSQNGLNIYEVGCDGAEGYWLEQTASGWLLAGCLQVIAEGQNCSFTDPGEQHAWMRARLAGTSADGCDVAELRGVGVSSQGRHYEARCNAPGEGYLVRITADGRAAVTPCAAANDCVLTRARRTGG